MNIMQQMNEAVDYIEQHLTDDIEIDTLARLTALSAYNFQRMFSCIANVSVVEYIRRRRMTMAALDMQKHGVKVIDVALKYGYESPVSFARAFKDVHGITPSQAKGSRAQFTAYQRITFQISVTGVMAMNYRIEKTNEFQVFGIEGLVSTAGGRKYYSSPHEMWQKNHKNGKYEKLFSAVGNDDNNGFFEKPMCRIHAMMNYKKINSTTFAYMQCALVAPESKTDGYTVFTVPKTTWAVFSFELDNWDVGKAAQQFNKRFYSEWLPVSGYVKLDAPEFEMYGGTPENGFIEFWMPVKSAK